GAGARRRRRSTSRRRSRASAPPRRDRRAARAGRRARRAGRKGAGRRAGRIRRRPGAPPASSAQSAARRRSCRSGCGAAAAASPRAPAWAGSAGTRRATTRGPGPARPRRTIPRSARIARMATIRKEAPAPPERPPPLPLPKTFALDEHHLVRSVNGLAIPIIAENLFQTMLGVVVLAMVGTLGAVAIAGTGSALQIMFLVIAALSAVTVGTTVLVARFTGAGEPHEASRAAKQSLLMAVGLAAVVTVLGHFFAH